MVFYLYTLHSPFLVLTQFGMHLNSSTEREPTVRRTMDVKHTAWKLNGSIDEEWEWDRDRLSTTEKGRGSKPNKKSTKNTTTMTTAIRYNYVFAFIHYYCLTALSASLFRCAKCALLHKARRFLCGRSTVHSPSLWHSVWEYACRAVVAFQTHNLFSFFRVEFLYSAQKEHNNAQIFYSASC